MSPHGLTFRSKLSLFADLVSLDPVALCCMHCHLLPSVHLQQAEHAFFPLKEEVKYSIFFVNKGIFPTHITFVMTQDDNKLI